MAATATLAGKAPRRTEFVEALARGLAVIEAFDAGHAEMTLSEVARRAGMTPATARRGLHTLAALGYVRQVGRRFILSARILQLGAAYLRATHVEEILIPELRQLVARFGDAASVAALEGDQILYIAHHSEQRARRMMAGIGVTYPAFATSLGRVLLSALSEADLDRFFSRLKAERLTVNTVTEPDRLRAIVGEVRRQGYAVCVDELDYGITALATPVRDATGQVVAALNSSGYTGHVTAETMIRERLPELRESAARMSQALMRNPALLHSISGGRGRDEAPQAAPARLQPEPA